MNIKDILRHRHDFALPRAQIAAAVGVSTGTVPRMCLPGAEAGGGSPGPLPSDLDDEALSGSALSGAGSSQTIGCGRDWDAIIEELTAPRKRRRAPAGRGRPALGSSTATRLWPQGGRGPIPTGRFLCAAQGSVLHSQPRAGADAPSTTRPGLLGACPDFSGKGRWACAPARGEKDIEIFVAVLGAFETWTLGRGGFPIRVCGTGSWRNRRAFRVLRRRPRIAGSSTTSRPASTSPNREEPPAQSELPRVSPSTTAVARVCRPRSGGGATDKGLVRGPCVGAVFSRASCWCCAIRPSSRWTR